MILHGAVEVGYDALRGKDYIEVVCVVAGEPQEYAVRLDLAWPSAAAVAEATEKVMECLSWAAENAERLAREYGL